MGSDIAGALPANLTFANALDMATGIFSIDLFGSVMLLGLGVGIVIVLGALFFWLASRVTRTGQSI